MHKRGYRGETIHKAALRETLGAAIVMASKWDGTGGTVLIDPMGGSGTICIEAALIACDTAPGLIRYQNRLPVVCQWPDLRDTAEAEWESVVAEAEGRDKRFKNDANDAGADDRKLIVYNDVHEGSIDLAEEASERAGVAGLIDFSSGPCDVAHLEPPRLHSRDAGGGAPQQVIVTNPPWDRRLDEDAEYSWEALKGYIERAGETEVFCLAGEPSLVKLLGLRPAQNLVLHVGDVEMRLLKFHPSA